MGNSISEFSWVGSQANFVDLINVNNFKQVSLGRFGGNSLEGQYKNEDGCLIWIDEKANWEFTVILDAHNSAESAELVLEQFSKRKSDILLILSLPYEQTLKNIEGSILNLFQEDAFLTACRKVKGETACLIVLRKDKYVWWFSIGDCISYVFHPELANLGQYQINQRQLYEWVGLVNTFDQVVPCYSSGIRELRKGKNRIFLTTDGLIECPKEPYSSPKEIYNVMKSQQIDKGILKLLQTIKGNNVIDSTTIISWEVKVTKEVARPSEE
ncbi:protein phosphatase 2C domain-containing protein [Cytobacillus sp. IB215665]|uniref:protein phosphatase 2C domain-containing protein n=1 Tax=Cytobacillus sp. IB215665 TaxID=3097357 RepID=UPI002A1098D9|nr:protein phosphatase 2C domain-containing protein [Cytobacillus sp. IB215665]MDX8367712.1 protein phosphatase 2C domain-containing protein [Cytobacillus sp. IB215665]